MLSGTAIADITPPDGSLMACFPRGPERTPRRAVGALDPLKAKALVLRDGQEAVAVCACDLTMLRGIDIERIRRRVADAAPELGGPRTILCATHTHSSPETSYLFGNSPDDPWVREMDARIADAVIEAYRAAVPASLLLGRVHAELSHNRRVAGPDGRSTMVLQHRQGVTDGPVDPDLVVLRIDRDGAPGAVLWNYAAHALTCGPKCDGYTADFPGVANGIVETALGATALFCNGGAGNVHPRECMRADSAAAEKMGSLFAAQVLGAARNAEPLNAAGIAFQSETLAFANRVDESLRTHVELSCLRLGELAIAFEPGEPFVEFQLAFKARLAPRPAMFVGYANDWCGYVPTRAAYPEGGYGVDLCTTDPPEYSRTALPEGAGETMLEKLVELAG